MLRLEAQTVDAPVVWQAKVGKGVSRLHALVTQVVNCEDAACVLQALDE